LPSPQLIVLTRFPDFAEEVLLARGAQSVTQVDAADDPVLEPGPGEAPLWPRTRTIGLFPAKHDLGPVIAALRETLPDGTAAIITTAALKDADWVRIWLREWKPLRFGERLWVSPRAKVRSIRQRNAVVVALDPGLAFGTGTHPSTALCLEWLAAADVAGKSVLDHGCGSGLLAIAALKLGAARATAVDIDPQALLATRENAAANGVAGRLAVVDANAYRPARHDIVIANILARPLVELAPRLRASAAAGATLVLAGLLRAQAAQVRAAYRSWLRFRPARISEGWVRLEGTPMPGRRASGRLRTQRGPAQVRAPRKT
jgi:ribosomal protein L11 methyltransferase